MSIKEELRQILKNLTQINNFEILEPSQEDFGDYSSNLAFILAQKKHSQPQKIAEQLAARLRKEKLFSRVEVAGEGFLNFFLAPDYLYQKLADILAQDNYYGKKTNPCPLNIQVEFISANPTGPLHLGHGRNAFFGDVLANVLSYAGHKVTREFYVNDAKESTQIKELGKSILGISNQYKSKYLSVKKEALGNKIKNLQDEGELGQFISHQILADFKKLTEKIGIKFDNWFFEQSLYDGNKKEQLLKWLGEKGLTYSKDGALWLKTTDFGDEKDRVIIRSSGDITYFLSDILYHQDKIARGFDQIINVWGADHQGHERRMQALMKILGYKGKLIIPIIQMVRLKTKDKGVQKMSKRLGTAIELEWLIDLVGKDVVRFLMTRSDVKSQMIFDIDLAKEKSEKNPVFYLQYALVRCYSILRKSPIALTKSDLKALSHLEQKEELALIKCLIKFPALIQAVALNHEIHHLSTYAVNTAKNFHQFYRNCQVIDQNNSQQTQARLSLVKAASIVFERIFELIGIEKLKKM